MSGDLTKKTPVFCYFDRPDHALIAPFLAEWQAAFPQFRICSDADVLPILAQIAPQQADLYAALRLPAARADIARLALLWQGGGLYVDCHCGIRDPGGVRAMLDQLSQLDLIVMRRDPASFPDPATAHPPILMNGVLAARKGTVLVEDMLRTALENLERYLDDQRRASGFVLYDLWPMLGAWVVTNTVLEAAADYRQFRKEARGRVRVMAQETCPILVGAHARRYNIAPSAGAEVPQGPGARHWSLVQQNEPLFDPSALPALLAARVGRPRPGFSDPADPGAAPSAP